MDWNSAIKCQKPEQTQRLAQGANHLVRNKQHYAMNTQWHCELPSLCLFYAHFALRGRIQFPAAVWGFMSPVLPPWAPHSPSLSASLTPFQPALLGSQGSPEACPARHETFLQALIVFRLFFPNHLVPVLAWEDSKIAQVPSQTSSKGYQNVTSTFTRQIGLQKTTLDKTWNKTF